MEDKNDVEEAPTALSRARAQAAVSCMRRSAAVQGADRLSDAEINAEIAQTRQQRRVFQAGRSDVSPALPAEAARRESA